MEAITSALICTNQLFMWAGSELVAIEMAEELLGRGVQVTLCAPLADRAFLRAIFPAEVGIHDHPDTVDLTRHDLVYAQHHVFPLILEAALARGDRLGCGPVLVCNHLSPTTPLEAPGPWVEASLADVILANSPETQARLASHGPPFDGARLWPNPAPADFAGPLPPAPAPALLAVANFRVPELDAALAQLVNEGIPVQRIGRQHRHARLRPEDLAPVQGVVSIGKTVQYALRAGRPVYCYGPHGGPGWLTADSYAAARAANFSGRSHPHRKTAEHIARELRAGPPGGEDGALALAQGLDPVAEGFCLEPLVEGLLEEAGRRRADPVWQARRRALLASAELRQRVALEANLARAVADLYLKLHRDRAQRLTGAA